MPGYRVQIRLNLRPDFTSEVVETLLVVLPGNGLSLRDGVPGLIEGEDLSLEQLETALNFVNKLAKDRLIVAGVHRSRLLDDVWIHVSHCPKSHPA